MRSRYSRSLIAMGLAIALFAMIMPPAASTQSQRRRDDCSGESILVPLIVSGALILAEKLFSRRPKEPPLISAADPIIIPQDRPRRSKNGEPVQSQGGETQPTQPAADSATHDQGARRRPQAPPFDRPPINDATGDDRGRAQPPVLAPSPGQNSPNHWPSGDADDVIRLDAGLVNIPVLVSDRSGRYIPNLTERDFEIYEDGVKQEIAFFTSEEVPFNIALLLDVSPSVQGSLEEIQRAALEFVRQMRPQDRIMIVAFDHKVDFLTDFTNDRHRLQQAIMSTDTGSGTSVYEAVYYTIERKLRQIEGRKAIILLSDGEDTTSRRIGYQDAINAVVESDVLAYGIHYPSEDFGAGVIAVPLPLPLPIPIPMPRRRPRGHPSSGNGFGFMSELARAGGGLAYEAKSIRDLSSLARQVAEELRHVYVLSYYPTNPLTNGGYRSIRVRMVRGGDLAVRHRRGYDAGQAQKTKWAIAR
jgi:Ca-activated chloride channel family protein